MATVLNEPTVDDDSDVLYEVIDGVIVEKPPMGTFEEVFSNLLTQELCIAARSSRAGTAFNEVMFDFTEAVGRKMRPDASFLSAARWPIGKRAPDGDGWAIVPNLAIEVISNSNSAREMARKVRDYFQVGVEQVWIVEPVEEWVHVYSSPKQITVLHREDDLSCEPLIPGFRLPLAQLFIHEEPGQ